MSEDVNDDIVDFDMGIAHHSPESLLAHELMKINHSLLRMTNSLEIMSREISLLKETVKDDHKRLDDCEKHVTSTKAVVGFLTLVGIPIFTLVGYIGSSIIPYLIHKN